MGTKGKLSQVLERDRGKCQLCGGLTSSHDETGPNAPTLDHIIPKARGGVDALWNLQLAHRRCNESKGDRMPSGNRAKRLARRCRRHRRRHGARTTEVEEPPW